MAASSSKVAALANIFQQNDCGGRRGSGVYDDRSLERSAKKGLEVEENRIEAGGLKYFKNSVNIRRTSSQVARFSSAKKVFETKDKDSSKWLKRAEVRETQATVKGLTENVQIQLRVSAVNHAGKSQAREFHQMINVSGSKCV